MLNEISRVARTAATPGDFVHRITLLAMALALAAFSGCGANTHHAPFYSGPSSSGASTDAGAGGDVDAGKPAAVSSSTVPNVGCKSGPELHVLFIGNSHTYTNDLPALVTQLACAAGTKVTTQQDAPGGVGFTEHAASADTLAAIKAAPWDFVIMQDQQQRPGFRLAEVESTELPAATQLVDAIRANHKTTRPLFYMVWARRDGDPDECSYYPLVCTYEGFTRALAQGYQLYAERTQSEVASVALAWAAVRADPKPPLPAASLWAGDGSHPALPGSYLAASVLLGTMLDMPTVSLSYDAGLDKAVATYLRTVADRIVSADKADPRVTTAERVHLACDAASGCTDKVDAAAVTISLTAGTCADLRSGSAAVSGRIHTNMSCVSGACSTVPLGGWHEVPGAQIAEGAYQVDVQVDMNANGKLDTGDLVGCGDLSVGSGTDLTVSSFSAL